MRRRVVLHDAAFLFGRAVAPPQKNNSKSIFCTALHTDCTTIAHKGVNNRSRISVPARFGTSRFPISQTQSF
jgi:hypothetical protein